MESLKTRKMNQGIFDQNLATYQVTLDLTKLQEGIVKMSHEEYGYTWLPITVIRHLQLLEVAGSHGVYRLAMNQGYWEDIFWIH